MEYPWRSRPPPGNFCPVCSYSHFPFCTPPPLQYFRPPPPPPDQYFRSPHPPPPPPPPQPQASYDPFFDHQGGPNVIPYLPPPAPAQIPPRPWNGDPNYSNDYYVNSNSGLDHDTTGQVGIKRMRFDNVSDGHVSSSVEDERRLRLIRDHGAVSHGLDRKYDRGYSVSDRSYEPSNFQGIESDYHTEINSSINQNYGESQVAFQHIENNRSLHNQSTSNVVHNHGYGNSPGADGYRNFKRARENHEIPAYDDSSYQEQQRKFSAESRECNNQFMQSHATLQHRMEPQSSYYGLSNQSENMRLIQDHQRFKAQPPLPTSPPPPLPVEPPRFHFSEPVTSSASGPGSLFPVAVNSAISFHSLVSEAKTSVSSHSTNKGYSNSCGFYPEEIQAVRMASTKTFNGESEGFSPMNHSLDKPKIIDASHILKHPHRANRPDHIVIILRGLPGSGKSYLAKVLRDFEVENGGTAPRIHSMDEYFMTEVEKVEESEGSRSSGSVRGKKPVMRKIMEYCYEPEMEEAYRSSMLKAFKKTLDEGAFPFIIVDDRNLRVADFAQFWATAKRSGYEVYLLEATYKDPAGCAARNVHGFTQNDILKMAKQWEEAPSLYMKLDVKSLLHGDDLVENGIEEVDMDTEDGNHVGDTSGSEVLNIEENLGHFEGATDGPSTDEQKEDGQEEHPVDEVKDLGKSKWSNNVDDDDSHKTEASRGNSSALSSLIKSYRKKGKSVRWADQIGRVGFSISAGKTANVSLVMGSGSGYNLKSNPLPEEDKLNQRFTGESRRQNVFQEQLRAERESFRAVFDKRKQRIGGLNAYEE